MLGGSDCAQPKLFELCCLCWHHILTTPGSELNAQDPHSYAIAHAQCLVCLWVTGRGMQNIKILLARFATRSPPLSELGF